LGINGIYVAFDVDRRNLADAVNGIRALGIRGANVTMPFKKEVVKYLDALDVSAHLCCAVNTIVNVNSVLTGYNTDGEGALKALDRFTIVDGKKVLLLGAGGAGSAIASALIDRISDLIILNRDVSKAHRLVERLGRREGKVKARKLSYTNLEREIKDSDILINATSIGFKNDVSPVPRRLLRPSLVVMDIVYAPLRTRLLRYAEEEGCVAIDGLWMLIYQGAESFRIWTGVYPPIEVMRKAALRGVGN
jgi:shikimate dehydrogenase